MRVYISKRPSLLNKVLSGFDDDAIFQLDTDSFSSVDDHHVIYSRINPFKEGVQTKLGLNFCLKSYIESSWNFIGIYQKHLNILW
jgi:hypothetical protein